MKKGSNSMHRSIAGIWVCLSAAVLTSACGSDDAADGQQPGARETVAANVPQKDTGWERSTKGDGSFRISRQLNQLTVFYELSPTASSPVTLGADVFPCLRGKGNHSSRETFTPGGSTDGDQLASIRRRFATVLNKANDRCDIPADVADNIMSGFDGQFFQTSGKRRSVRPN
ncbi:hypothetical protein [Qipengyuania sphaerica]|uniref:hypothetical protein n=1 Tax=Qipengyuania sphaerica TaxID=2867243 RepID=UPI001C86934A|nr:hypothetical protein [Qipengyuania sphaerica]MBX7540782.1 hypothetical protein [Qipengyuania sphaerica]